MVHKNIPKIISAMSSAFSAMCLKFRNPHSEIRNRRSDPQTLSYQNDGHLDASRFFGKGDINITDPIR